MARDCEGGDAQADLLKVARSRFVSRWRLWKCIHAAEVTIRPWRWKWTGTAGGGQKSTLAA